MIYDEDLGKVTNATEQWEQFKPKLKEKANQLMYRYSYHCETCSEFTEICDHFTLVKEHSPIFCNLMFVFAILFVSS